MSNFITEINIKKVRHLENIDIVLGDEKKHLILTGKNGSGKTSVLEELDSFFSEIYNRRRRGLFAEDEKVQNTDLKFKQNILNIKNENFIYAFFKAQRTINDIDKSTHAEKIIFPKEKTAKLNQLFIRYMVGLKIERAFAKDDEELELVEKLDRWFDNFEKTLRKIFNDNSLVLKFDRNPFSYNFRIEREGRESFDFYTMSAGYSSIMDIVTELILKIENTESKSFDCEGMVLIDEVDNHLHVELQKNILPLLTSFFPNIQFIVTTHSPFVLSSLENTVIYDLEKQIRVEDLSGYSYDSLIESYFDSDKYSKEVKEKIEIFEKLADRDDLSDSEKDEYYKLKKYFDSLPTFMSDELAVKLNEIKLRNMFKAG
jgi:predicted ATP-binding protein involved in virulence